MQIIERKIGLNNEFSSAIFIIALISIFLVANFFVGFRLPLYFVTVGLSAAISFIYPRSGIYSIIILSFLFSHFFTLEPIYWGRSVYKLYPLDILLLATYFRIGIELVSKKLSFKWNGLDSLVLLFISISIGYFAVSVTALNADAGLALSSLKSYAFYPLLYFMIRLMFQTKTELLKLFKIALAGSIAIAFLVIYGILNGQGLWTEYTPLSTEGIRILSFPHAFFISLALIGILAWLSFERKSEENKWLIFSLLIVIGILGSLMRHLWIGLGVAIALLYYFLPLQMKRNANQLFAKYITIGFATIFIAVFSAALLPQTQASQIVSAAAFDIYERAGSLVRQTNEDESFAWRGAAWKTALDSYQKQPLLGLGFGQKVYVEMDNYQDFIEVRNIHNSLLVILVQLGIIPFLIFCWIIIKTAKDVINVAKKDWIEYALLGSLIFYTIVSLFQPYLETNLLAIFFWMILGLLQSNLERIKANYLS